MNKNDNYKDDIIILINKQKQGLINWEEKIKNILNADLNHTIEINIYLIDAQWLQKYINKFFLEKILNETVNYMKKFELIDNSTLSNDIYDGRKFFILNEECWNLFVRDKTKEIEIKYKGFFDKNILLFMNNKNLFLLYLDKNKDIKNKYIQINNNVNIDNIQYKILSFFKENYTNFGDIQNITIENNEYIVQNINCCIFEKTLLDNKYTVRKYNSFNSSNANSNISKKKENDKNNKFSLFKKDMEKEKEIKIYQQNDNNNHQNNISNDNVNKNEKKKEDLLKKVKKIPINPSTKIFKNNYKQNKEIFNPITKIKRNTSVKQRRITRINIEENKNDDFLQLLPNRPIKKLPTPGLIGLSKINSTSSMNAIIQCFSNISILNNELLKKELYQELEKNCLNNYNKKISFALVEVLKNIWEISDKNIYDSKSFKNIINQYFKNDDGREPVKLIYFLLDELHKELNKPNMNINIYVNNENIYNIQNKILNDFMYCKKNYEKNNNSIISKLFEGFEVHFIKCNICNYYLSNNFSNFKIINFNLDDIKKFKNNNCNCITLYDCFEYNRRNEEIASICNYCNYKLFKNRELIYMPYILIISFNYGQQLQDNTNITCEDYLNLKQYIMDDNSPFYYELIGAICGLNVNNNDKHFIAFCRNNKNYNWYKYDDDMVTKSLFQEISSNGKPYILFYSYIKK